MAAMLLSCFFVEILLLSFYGMNQSYDSTLASAMFSILLGPYIMFCLQCDNKPVVYVQTRKELWCKMVLINVADLEIFSHRPRMRLLIYSRGSGRSQPGNIEVSLYVLQIQSSFVTYRYVTNM